MIPTKYKRRLPKEVCYPLGAQRLSEILEGVPQFAELSITFTWAGEGIRRLRRLLEHDHLVIEATLERFFPSLCSSNSSIAQGYYEPRWGLTAFAVPRQAAGPIKRTASRETFAEMIAWLSSPRPESWYDGSKCFLLTFDLDSESFRGHEY